MGSLVDSLPQLSLFTLPLTLMPEEVTLLVEKAGGNFLTMIENISELHSKPDYFVDGSSTKPLSPKGITNIQKWESNRQIGINRSDLSQR